MLPPSRNFLAPTLAFVLASIASCTELPSLPETPVIPKLHLLARKAGYIFSGRVKSVERIAPSAANSVPVMRVTFQVDKGFLGVRSGQELVIHECAGVWQSGESYRPGEKVLLFLYPPSKLGLTSPVGGMSGRFAVDPGGRIIIDPGRTGLGPPRRLPPMEGIPKTILLRPEDFARALRTVLEE
jgi:hypothetical protein